MIRIVPLSFWSSFPKTASRGRNRDGGARACAARGRSAARTLAAPDAYAAHAFAAFDFSLFDGAFACDEFGGRRSEQAWLLVLAHCRSVCARQFAHRRRAPDGGRTRRDRASCAPSLFQNVVEIEAFRRAQPLEAYAGIGSQFGVAFRVAVPGRVRVGGARDEGIRDGGEPGQHRLQCAEGTGPHPAAGRNVEGVTAAAFERGEAERVDRPLGDGDTAHGLRWPGRTGTASYVRRRASPCSRGHAPRRG